jgi:putative protease
MDIELLAPAGSYESLIAAINAGADAVYIGGSKFGARAYANNLSEEELIKAIDFVHLHGKKLYLTINTLLKEKELTKELFDYIHNLYRSGLDAVIVQDIGVLSFMKENFPDLPIHASTQMTVTGDLGAGFLEKQGVSRVVTSREVSLEEIREIRRNTNLEIESFVHGALCYCYSGQCLYSSLIGGRSGNRGRCAQPCRLPYEVWKEGQRINRKNEGYILSPKDICTLDILGELIEAGVTSFKIEGRMKKPEYTAGVVQIYRKYINLYFKEGKEKYRVEEADKIKLMDLYNRGGFSKGYYVQRNGRKMISLSRPNHFGTPIGKVKSIQKGKVVIHVSLSVNQGDVLEFMGMPDGERLEVIAPENRKENQELTLSIGKKSGVFVGQNINRTRNVKLLEELHETAVQKSKEKIKGNLILLQDLPVILNVEYGNHSVKVSGGIVSKAQKQPLTKEALLKQMNKTGNTPFIFESLQITLDEDVFLPIQALNALRREALELLENTILEPYRRGAAEPPLKEKSEKSIGITNKKMEINIYIEHIDYLDILIPESEVTGIYIDCNAVAFPFGDKTLKSGIERCNQAGKHVFFVFPHIFRTETKNAYIKGWNSFISLPFQGIMIKSLEEFQFLKDMNYKGEVIIDHNLYTFNHKSIEFWKGLNISYDTVPLELNYREVKERGCCNSEYIVYGYLPMMVSAQCVQNTAASCTKQSCRLYIKDRKNKSFCVRNRCEYCYNTIYNSEPMIIYDKIKEICALNPRSVRLNFTLESVAEARRIITEAIHCLRGEGSGVQSQKGSVISHSRNFTRGHFNRGIE